MFLYCPVSSVWLRLPHVLAKGIQRGLTLPGPTQQPPTKRPSTCLTVCYMQCQPRCPGNFALQLVGDSHRAAAHYEHAQRLA